jgi:hypothetical protein
MRADDPTTGGEGGPWEGINVAAGGRLIVLSEEDSQWHFCLPLFVLNTIRDLTDYVVTPVISLLQGNTPDVALGNHPHAFRFQAVDGSLELAEVP